MPAQHLPEIPWTAVAILLAGLVGCIGVWTFVARRLAWGETVLRCQPRRPVPWRGSDVFLILMAYFFPALLVAGQALFVAVQMWLAGAKPLPPPPVVEKAQVSHPVIELLQAQPHVSAWLLCIVSVVLVAPVVEEVLFRLVLQGWLESVEARTPPRQRLWPKVRGFWPVGLASLLFAALHFRTAQPTMAAEEVELLLAKVTTWNLVALGFAGTLLVVRRGATWTDLGFVPGKLGSDIRLGLLAFVAVAVPIYLAQAGLQRLLQGVAADPITLSFFAMVLGVLYFRTHRLVASIVLHMALNSTSLLLAWLLGG